MTQREKASQDKLLDNIQGVVKQLDERRKVLDTYIDVLSKLGPHMISFVEQFPADQGLHRQVASDIVDSVSRYIDTAFHANNNTASVEDVVDKRSVVPDKKSSKKEPLDSIEKNLGNLLDERTGHSSSSSSKSPEDVVNNSHVDSIGESSNGSVKDSLDGSVDEGSKDSTEERTRHPVNDSDGECLDTSPEFAVEENPEDTVNDNASIDETADDSGDDDAEARIDRHPKSVASTAQTSETEATEESFILSKSLHLRVTLRSEALNNRPRNRHQVRDLIATEADVPKQCLVVHSTPEGYSVYSSSAATQEALLSPLSRLAISRRLRAKYFGLGKQWITYAVEGIPNRLRDPPNASLDVDAGVIRDLAHRVTKRHPVRAVKADTSPDPKQPANTWWIMFSTPVRPFQVVKNGSWSREIVHSGQGIHNPGCQRYCDPNKCSLEHCCNRCSVPCKEHSPGACTAPPRCINCHGPFEAGHDDCPLAAIRRKGKTSRPSREDRKRIQAAGRDMYTEALINASDCDSDSETIRLRKKKA